MKDSKTTTKCNVCIFGEGGGHGLPNGTVEIGGKTADFVVHAGSLLLSDPSITPKEKEKIFSELKRALRM